MLPLLLSRSPVNPRLHTPPAVAAQLLPESLDLMTAGSSAASAGVALEIRRVRDETLNVKSFTFGAAEADTDKLDRLFARYEPGQYATIRISGHGSLSGGGGSSSIDRNWTITRRSAAEHTFDITVKLHAAGAVTPLLHAHPAHTGQPSPSPTLKLELVDVAGDFVLLTQPQLQLQPQPAPPATNLFIAAGVGITPLYAMLMAHHGGSGTAAPASASHVLLHVDRSLSAGGDTNSILLQAEFEALQWTLGGRLAYIPWDTRTKGRPTVDQLLAVPAVATVLASESGSRSLQVYLCGPQVFMNDVSAALVLRGIRSESIHTEDFSF